MDDPVSAEEKGRWFREMLSAQEKIAGERTAKLVGKTLKVLAETVDDKGFTEGRTGGNVIIKFRCHNPEKVIGSFVNVKVTKALTWIVEGELLSDN